ncbi:cellulose binding domain-containing protein [Kitasatospora sp. NPDC001540]|uniref:cellulose binding domain-containing protein n=1 Tax=Kitasatospora sp. NPDC001540 TaxID=3364014 RepID=UPI0036A3025F
MVYTSQTGPGDAPQLPGTQTTAPGAPGAPVASGVTSGSVKLDWTAAPAGSNPLAGYDVYQVGSPDKVVASTGAGTLSATVTGLSPATAYRFYVKAKDSTGLVSPASAAVSVTTQSAQPTGSAKVAYATTGDWGSGFTAQVTLTNTGTQTLDHWSLAFAFPGNQRVTSGWGGTWSQSGSNVTASDAGWNGTLAPGQSVTVGFSGTYTGTNSPPTAFTVNGDPAITG